MGEVDSQKSLNINEKVRGLNDDLSCWLVRCWDIKTTSWAKTYVKQQYTWIKPKMCCFFLQNIGKSRSAKHTSPRTQILFVHVRKVCKNEENWTRNVDSYPYWQKRLTGSTVKVQLTIQINCINMHSARLSKSRLTLIHVKKLTMSFIKTVFKS